MLKEGVILGERYEIISRIGSGGMADVYKAMDHKLNRMVAVKVLKPEFREDKTFITKFRSEAQAAAGLSHPNVVNVFDVGEDRGVYYIVMELVEGITLKDYINRKGKLSVKEATSIAIQVSLGLEAAHNRGIVHRDVKPQNIIISTDGKVKLSDFGIAKATSSNTISSNVMGSVHYSSPEQVRGGYSDYKSDIYSLGITIYEMVTGRVPFDGDTTVAIAIKHLQEEIEAPSKYTPSLPFSLEQIILKCTQKSPDRRYRSMAELIDDLKHSLMDPNGNFVTLMPLSSHAQTVMVSEDELDRIRSGSAAVSAKKTASEQASSPRYSKLDDDDEDDYDSRYDDDDEEDDYDDYDDDDYDDDDDEEESGGKLEKVVTIGGFVVAAVVICVLIYVIAQALGLIGGKKNNSADSSSVSNSVTVTATPTPEDTNSVSGNTETVTVPDLKNKTEEEAQKVANDLGLGVVSGGTEASDVEEGKICRQDLQPGTQVPKNSTITYYVSAGSGKVTIPTGLVGQSKDAVQASLNSVGLEVSFSEDYSDDVEAGNVITLEPGEGSTVDQGSTVTVVVSKGSKSAKEVSVPSVAGLSEADATDILEGKGLKVTTTTASSNKVDIGEVISQSPEAGTKAAPGSTVTLVINTKDAAAEPTAEPSEDAQSVTWSCNKSLNKPENYNGGVIRLEVIQNINGTEQSVWQDEGMTLDDSKWPYPINIQWTAPSDASADVYILISEMDSTGNYQAISKSSTFTASKN